MKSMPPKLMNYWRGTIPEMQVKTMNNEKSINDDDDGNNCSVSVAKYI
jgi:hypothetical protein